MSASAIGTDPIGPRFAAPIWAREYTQVGASSRNGLARIGQVVDPDVIFYFYDGHEVE